MKVYVCGFCGYIYDESVEGVRFEDLPDDWECPMCGVGKDQFQLSDMEPKNPDAVLADAGKPSDSAANVDAASDKAEDSNEPKAASEVEATPEIGATPEVQASKDPGEDYSTPDSLKWPAKFKKHDHGPMDEIHEISETGKSVTEPMETLKPVPGFDEILILGAQLAVMPLDDDAPVNTRTVIGKKAKKPMVLESPIYVSHMSFGSLSRETKVALARGAASVKTAVCSGEGGILPEERSEAYKYIFEIIPNMYSVTDENLRNSDAIEIKIGQGTKPGMGGHLPGAKVTEEIARIRGKKVGEDIKSPSHFPNIRTPEDLKAFVSELRERSEGRPIGVKIAAGRIEQDLEFILKADPDFITIDGRGGATGSSPKFLKDHTTVPTVYALHRAVKYLRQHNADVQLVITGGLRTSGDFAKALAMGADAVAISSSALMAVACMRYRICHNDRCPMGIATQDPKLRERLIVEKGTKRLENFLRVSNEELKSFARCTGNDDVHKLSLDDIETTSMEISQFTDVRHC